MQIRLANYKDLDVIRNLYKELDKDAVYYQPEHFIMSVRSDEYLCQLIEGENSDILVAEEDGELIGFLILCMGMSKQVSCLKSQRNIYIQDLIVTEFRRSLGVGTLLMEGCKEYGARKGAEFIRTQVFPRNIEGIRFYEKNGFKEMMKTIECQL